MGAQREGESCHSIRPPLLLLLCFTSRSKQDLPIARQASYDAPFFFNVSSTVADAFLHCLSPALFAFSSPLFCLDLPFQMYLVSKRETSKASTSRDAEDVAS